MFSLLIKNGTVIDGTGKPGFLADVVVEENTIVNVGKGLNVAATQVIDARDKIVAPGFIDIQNHSDSYWQLFDNPGLDSLVAQGFTTIAVGQCGASLAPLLTYDSLLALRKWHSMEGNNTNWQSFAEFVQHMSAVNYGCNVLSLVGYATIRRAVVPENSTGPINTEQWQTIEKALTESLQAGAAGVSHGLAYAHERSVSKDELLKVAQLVKKFNGLLSIHLREQGAGLIDQIGQLVELAKTTGVNVKISHLQIRDTDNAKDFPAILELLETAQHQGAPVHFDVYPYSQSWQVLYQYLPSWATDQGRDTMLKVLADSAQRKKIIDFLNNKEAEISSLVISSTSNHLPVIGKSIGEIAKAWNMSSEQALLHLLENGGSQILVFEDSNYKKELAQLINHPLAHIATDGAGFPLGESLQTLRFMLMHPRCYGTAPKFLQLILASEKASGLEQAIYKLTGGPAKTLGLNNRGSVSVGSKADLVVFDPKTIGSQASLQNPYQQPTGIDSVIVNGQFAMERGMLQSKFSGLFLTK